jgi:Kef-type K+ transport system membrane component KefB
MDTIRGFMESHTFLLQLVFILLSARLLGEVAAHFNIPSVLGELIAGILIGPSLLNLVQATPPIHLLAEIGLILLLFEVGLETDIGRLAKAGMKAFKVATGGVIFPFVLGLVFSFYFFQLSFLTSLFIASTLTATSIGITLRVLGDLKKQNNHEAQIILGAAVLDDIVGIIILSLLYEFSTSGAVNIWNAGKVFLFIVLFFVIAPLAAKLLSFTIKKWEEKSDIPGLLPATIVSLILFFAWIAHAVGAPELLGGFAAGLALSRHFFFPAVISTQDTKDFTHRIEEQMRPIIHLFSPIFFVAIGLSLNLREVTWSSSFIWLLSGSLLVAALIGKFASGFLLTKESLFTRCVIGTAMIPRGEVGLIFAEVGISNKIFDNQIYASLILVITITTLFAPFALRGLYTKSSLK